MSGQIVPKLSGERFRTARTTNPDPLYVPDPGEFGWLSGHRGAWVLHRISTSPSPVTISYCGWPPRPTLPGLPAAPVSTADLICACTSPGAPNVISYRC